MLGWGGCSTACLSSSSSSGPASSSPLSDSSALFCVFFPPAPLFWWDRDRQGFEEHSLVTMLLELITHPAPCHLKKKASRRTRFQVRPLKASLHLSCLLKLLTKHLLRLSAENAERCHKECPGTPRPRARPWLRPLKQPLVCPFPSM